MTQTTTIPTCYFPSTVVFIDDSQDFLLNFTLQLRDDLVYRMFNSPQEALDLLNSTQRQSDYLNQRCFSEYLESISCPLSNQTINLNLSAIHSEIYNSKRFDEISVVIVDFSMPGMNGLEFCEKLENTSIKKILLTGQANEKTTIEAFNKGIIDRYVQKHEPNVATIINENIAAMQYQYFQYMSDMIINVLAFNSPSCLKDKKFAEFFHSICQENQIIEYYLTENTGSFLLLDKDANASCLIVKNERELSLLHELALNNNAPAHVLEELKTGEKMPYFWQADNYYHSEWTDWSTCLYPANTIECNEIYYYALIKSPFSFDIQQNRITSYNRHLKYFDTTTEATS